METHTIVNLRRDPCAPGTLKPVGNPAHLTSGTWRPLIILDGMDSSRIFILANGLYIKIVEPSEEAVIGPLPAPAVCAMSAPQGVVAMTAAGAQVIARNADTDEWEVHPVAEPSAPLNLTSIDSATIVEATGTIPLTDTYSARSSALSAADSAAVARRLADAYCRLDTAAAAQGRYIQPMIGYFRMLDFSGSELYRSMPVVLGAMQGLNCTHALTAAMGTDAVGSISLQATPYKVGLRCNCSPQQAAAHPLMRRCATIEVMLTPQMHPASLSASVPSRITAGADNSLTLTTFVAGCSQGMTPWPTSQGATAATLMAHIDTAAAPAMRIAAEAVDLSATGVFTTLARPVAPGVAREIAAIGRIAASPVSGTSGTSASTATQLLERCRAPHSFSASTCDVAGRAVVWGDITARLYGGYSPLEGARTAAVGTGAAAAVTTVGAAHLKSACSGEGAYPLTLSPLLCYPLQQATVMRMDIAAPGHGTWRIERPLRTAPGCRYAFCIEPTLRPIDITGGTPIAEVDTSALPAVTHSEPQAVVTADIGTPLAAVGCSVVASGTISAVVAAPRSSTGWNIVTPRFYLFTCGGAHSLALNRRLEPGCPVLLRHGAHSAAGVATTDSAVYAVDSAGALVRYRGMQPTTLLQDVRCVGWSARHSELWVAMRDGEVRIYPHPDKSLNNPSSTSDNKGIRYYTRTGPEVRHLYPLGAALLIATGSELLDADSETEAAQTEVAYTVRRSTERAVRQLQARYTGTGLRGHLTVSVESGIAPGATVAVAEIDHDALWPLTVALAAPAREYATAALELTVGPDFRFIFLTIK